MAMPQAEDARGASLPETTDDVPPMPQNQPEALPTRAVQQAQAEAEHYATDVMTAFKKG